MHLSLAPIAVVALIAPLAARPVIFVCDAVVSVPQGTLSTYISPREERFAVHLDVEAKSAFYQGWLTSPLSRANLEVESDRYYLSTRGRRDYLGRTIVAEHLDINRSTGALGHRIDLADGGAYRLIEGQDCRQSEPGPWTTSDLKESAGSNAALLIEQLDLPN